MTRVARVDELERRLEKLRAACKEIEPLLRFLAGEEDAPQDEQQAIHILLQELETDL